MTRLHPFVLRDERGEGGGQHGHRIVATFLGPQDVPWLGRLLDEAAGLAGRPEFIARERWDAPIAGAPSLAVWQLAVEEVLRRLRPAAPPVTPRIARRALCAARAAAVDAPPAEILASVAAELAVDAPALEIAFVADLPGERRLGPAPEDLNATALVAAVNLAVARATLRHARLVAVRAESGVRAIVRVARLAGLICSVPEPASASEPVVHISGPLAIVTRTAAYGRAFASLPGRLPWCGRYRLSARCLVEGREATFELTSADALFPAPPPRVFDSRVEQRFARDVLRRAPDWDLVREPAAIPANGALLFPDFALGPRADPAARVLVEIAGFWTPAYLARKLEQLRAARIDRLILCVDEALRCGDGDLPGPANVPIVTYRRTVDAGAVLAAAAALLG